jgi:predicted metal-dependent hydrolase
MRRSHNTSDLVANLQTITERIDPALAMRFINLAMEVNQAQLDLISDTLTELEKMQQERLLNQGALIMSLISYTSSYTDLGGQV